ncbi:MAG: hypothetical protein QOF48_1404 [Verrucomicrobiota bacterium]
MKPPSSILIIGGGFAGVKCAKTLRRNLNASEAEIVLFNRENHLVFSPLLADAVGSSLNPLDVVVPLRELLPGVFCRTEEVRELDLDASEIIFEAHDGQPRRLGYDHVVIACGNVSNLGVVPGMADHAFALKTVGDADALRSHVLQQLEKAEVCDDPASRRWYLSFIVVGGGFSGAESAGELNDLVRGSLGMFRNIRADEVTVTLVHARDQILPEISPDLRVFAAREMEKAGVKLLLNARVQLATHDGVGLAGGQFIRGATIVCTIGSSIAPLVDRLAAPKERNRLLTEPDMRLHGRPNAWCVGDCAQIINAQDGNPSPPTGQFAERQGTQAAWNILRSLRELPTEPFSFRPLGQLCSIGGHSAVAEFCGLHLSGFLAWFIWRGVYLFKVPSWSRRFQIGFDWAWLLLFPRDLSHLRTTTTDRVSHAHYEPGDIVFRAGDAPDNFYVIEQGEVEIIRATPRIPDGEVQAVLAPGAFFGEKALLNNEPRLSTARARTAVEVLVMGRNVFTQVSKALEPLRTAFAHALNRRAVDVWKNQPAVRELLERTPLRDLMEPVPQPLLSPSITLLEVSQAFVGNSAEFFCVSADGQGLDGFVTMTDLIRAQSAGATGSTPLKDFMAAHPVSLSPDDSALTASMTLRDFRLKTLPIVERGNGRRLVGCIRARRLMAFVLKSLKEIP